MLSEYELINIVSPKRYTRLSKESQLNIEKTGPTHVVDEICTGERNFFRPANIRNLFDLFLYSMVASLVVETTSRKRK